MAPHGESKRQREREYQKHTIEATMKANPTAPVASVWKQLRGKSRTMQTLQDEFMRDFSHKGFDMIEGSKWTTFLMTTEFEDEGEYMTEAQIQKEECGCAAATKAKLDWAKQQGEGIAEHGLGKGYFKDPSRDNQYVYRYDKNLKDRTKIARTDGRQTRNFNAPLNVSDIQAGCSLASSAALPLPPPIIIPPPITDGSEQSEAGSPESAEDVGAQGVPELVKTAEELLKEMAGMELMEGFRKALEADMADVSKVKGVVRSNYRVVKQLKHDVDLIQKVLKLVEEL